MIYIYIYIHHESSYAFSWFLWFVLSMLECGHQELKRWLYVGPLQARSHIWTSETMVSYLSFLTEEIRARRRSLGIGLEARCLILADSATQHSAQQFEDLRKAWCNTNNVATWILFRLCVAAISCFGDLPRLTL